MTSYPTYEVTEMSGTGKAHNVNMFFRKFYEYLSEQTYNFHTRGQAVLLTQLSTHFEACLSLGDVLPSVISSASKGRSIANVTSHLHVNS